MMQSFFRNTRKPVAVSDSPPKALRLFLSVWRRAAAPFALLTATLLASLCYAQSDCIPQSTAAYYRKTPVASATRHWTASGDPAGKLVVIAVDDAIWSSLTAFNPQTGEQLWSHPLLGKTSQIAVSPNGEWTAIALGMTFCNAPKIQLWENASGTMQPRLSGWVNQQGYSVAFSSDSKLLAGSVNGQVDVWDVDSAKAIVQIEPPGFEDAKGIERIRDLDFETNGPHLSGLSGKVRYTWNWKSGKLVSKKAELRPAESGPAELRPKGVPTDTNPKMRSQWKAMDGTWKQLSGPNGSPANTPLQLTLDGGKTLVIPARAQ